VELASPADALAHGVGLLVEDRRQQGLLLQHEAIPNASYLCFRNCQVQAS